MRRTRHATSVRPAAGQRQRRGRTPAARVHAGAGIQFALLDAALTDLHR